MSKRKKNSRAASEIIELGLTGSRDHSQLPGNDKKIGAPSRAVVVLAVMLLGIAAIGAMASWRGSSSVSTARGSLAAPLPSPPTMPATGPAREYVYAGSSLISTVEPFREPPDDLAVWRPSDGTWYVLNAQQATVAQQWGTSTDVPAAGDYDGDGKTDFCVFRPSNTTWYIINSSNGSGQYPVFGASGDKPVVGDYDGDGRSDIAVWRESNLTFYVTRSSDGAMTTTQYGSTGDVPAPGDFDGDGKTDHAVWRPGAATFYVKKSTDGLTASYSVGANGDEPVVGDYDGDGKSDAAVRRPNDSSSFRILQSSNAALYTYYFGQSTDIAVPGRYNDASDTDSKTDVAVWRPSTGIWYIRRSSDGSTRAQQFGTNGDIPVPSNWRR